MPEPNSIRHAHISTSAFPADKRLAMWRDAYGRGIANVDIEPTGDVPFHADVTFNVLPGVSIADGIRSSAHYRVTRELAHRGQDVVILSILRNGVATTSQFGKELVCGVGSACLLTSVEPFTATLHTQGRFTTLALPRQTIAALVPNFAAAFGRTISTDNRALQLLTRYLDIACSGDKLADPEIARSVSSHILDVAALAIGARGDVADVARRNGGKVLRLSAIRMDIMENLGRSDLSTDMVAARQGISPRYLRKLFEEYETSFSSFVLIQRLVKAQSMLIDPLFAHLNIAQTAHESGFGDISYFNRVYRRQFGETPSDARAKARRDAQNGVSRFNPQN
jgi:AraC-like DNA-binding protein